MQQAFIVDVRDARVGIVDVQCLGLDGQLPVLDVVQLAAYYARNAAGIKPQAEVRVCKAGGRVCKAGLRVFTRGFWGAGKRAQDSDTMFS